MKTKTSRITTHHFFALAILISVALLGCNELAGIRPGTYDPCYSTGSTGGTGGAGGAVNCGEGGSSTTTGK